MVYQDKIQAVLLKDPVMRPLVGQLKFPVPTTGRDPYVDLVRTIIFQQLSVKAAQTIFDRFLNLFDDPWPNPNQLVQFDLEVLRSAGLSHQKAGYVKNVAEFFLEENLETYDWDAQEEESIIQLLTRIKGVGRWTAEMILMFTLNRQDIFPLDDLGIQTAIAKLYRVSKEDKDWKNQMAAIADAWRPYRTYASKYLWRYQDSGIGKGW